MTTLRGAYPVTPTDWPAHRLLDACTRALRGGPALLQYRGKPAPDAQLADHLRQRCLDYNVPLIINDDLTLASTLGVGVHLGRNDADVRAARTQLGPNAVIGVSVYDDVSRAIQLVEAGASYVSFGRFFPSRTKPDASPAQPDILCAARAQLAVPIAAIGGITIANARSLICQGADLLASVNGIFGTDDPEQAVRALNSMLSQT